MKALVLEKYNQFRLTDVEKPVLADNEILVQVKAAGICGSDVHGMDGSTGRRIPPIIMGHEASGIIVGLGSKVSGWKINDRVTFDSTIYNLDDWFTLKGQYNLSDNRQVLGVSCNEFRREGAFAEYIAIPEHILYRIPDEVSYEQAAMVEPVAVALHAIKLANINLNDSALVVGCGMIGLFVIQLLKVAGCGKIIAIDIDDEKLKMAKNLGATNCFNSSNSELKNKILQLTNERGTDHAFEAVGISDTVRHSIENVRKGGTVILLGNLSSEIKFPLQSVVTRQIKVQGSCAICGEYPEVLDLIASQKINVDVLISKVAPLDHGPDWFKRLYNKEKGIYKVILKP